ncbi:universal stress protein [Pengzhenrongella frigida]|uniref:Universal stress protein n=1 Tax=Pengzhenrongella frigida TaxID=1259133 RepID=A0A4V1ZH62_9MICO|nr:universal stress protein [Cellulomonas sp. HLT2-17]RYV50934.1 universal stress protein [Cellulomonas sp. HLT2-17]
MKTDGPVVIALDGSPHSEQTLDWGLAEATRRHAEVLLVRVFELPREFAEWSWYPLIDEDLGFETVAKEYLAELRTRERQRHPDLTIDSREPHGAEVPELRRLSETAQLLVIGAAGHGRRPRVGSVSGHLAAHARCPVAVVRAAPADPAAPVVVGVDGSPESVAAARTAAGAAALRQVPLVVLHARPVVASAFGRGAPVLATLPESYAAPTDPTQKAAQEIVDRLGVEHPTADIRLEVVADDPVHALVDASRRAQLVVVGSRGLGAFRGMLLGSVSHEVLRDAASTVLIMHDGRDDDRDE